MLNAELNVLCIVLFLLELFCEFVFSDSLFENQIFGLDLSYTHTLCILHHLERRENLFHKIPGNYSWDKNVASRLCSVYLLRFPLSLGLSLRNMPLGQMQL